MYSMCRQNRQVIRIRRDHELPDLVGSGRFDDLSRGVNGPYQTNIQPRAGAALLLLTRYPSAGFPSPPSMLGRAKS